MQRKVYFQTSRCTLPAKINIPSTRYSFLCICTPFKILIKYFHNITCSNPVLFRRQLIRTNAFNNSSTPKCFCFFFLFTFVNLFPQINLFYIFAKPHKIIIMIRTVLLCFIQENEIFLICVIFITVKT